MKINYKQIEGASLIALAFSILNLSTAQAQNCVVPPTCESLGYTKTAADCKDKDTLKCPLDTSKLFCVGEAETQEKGLCKSASVGTYLYEDFSCSDEIKNDKTIIGVIFDPLRRVALALTGEHSTPANTYGQAYNIPIPSQNGGCIDDFDGKNNTKAIVDYCKQNDRICPAAEYAFNYKTAGTQSGDWFAPAGGELNLIYQRRETLGQALERIGGEPLQTKIAYYSSSIFHISDDKAYTLYFKTGEWWDSYYNTSAVSCYIRPVIQY